MDVMAFVSRARRRLGSAILPPEAGPLRRHDANPLAEYFQNNPGRPMDKWTHYFDAYHRHFARFRGKPCVVLEFGVAEGGSLQMWRHYFGEQATIYGVDINPECKKFEEPGIRIFIGDQEDRTFLSRIAAEIGPVDVLIEDGGHTMAQQIATFDVFYPRLAPRGVFLIEDLHTSYWPEFGGGYREPGTFIEYAKDHIDRLNAWHSRDPELQVDEFTQTTRSMHVYGSIVVFEKGPVNRPRHQRTGRTGTSLDGAGEG